MAATTIFGFPAKLTIEVDGEEIDATSALQLVTDAHTRFEVDSHALLRLVDLERAVRRRVACS